MNNKSIGWKETPIKIIATNDETAHFTADVVNTYNELMHYMYYSMRDDFFIKMIKDGLSREQCIKFVINITFKEWSEEVEQIKIKRICIPEVKIILCSYHEFMIKCFEEDSFIVYYKQIELSHNKQSVI